MKYGSDFLHLWVSSHSCNHLWWYYIGEINIEIRERCWSIYHHNCKDLYNNLLHFSSSHSMSWFAPSIKTTVYITEFFVYITKKDVHWSPQVSQLTLAHCLISWHLQTCNSLSSSLAIFCWCCSNSLEGLSCSLIVIWRSLTNAWVFRFTLIPWLKTHVCVDSLATLIFWNNMYKGVPTMGIDQAFLNFWLNSEFIIQLL